MLALAWILGLLLGFVVLLVVTPVDVGLQVARELDLESRVTVVWLFGLVRFSADPQAVASDEAERPSAAPPAERSRWRARGSKSRRLRPLAMLQARGFVRSVSRLIGRLVRAIEVRRFDLSLRAGFDDPADTGLLAGGTHAILAVLPARARSHVDVESVFSGETFELAFDGEARLVPIRFLVPVAVFLLSPGTLRGVSALFRGRR